MNPIEFSSRLVESDMKFFLSRYAGLTDYEISSISKSKHLNEIFCYFSYNDNNYLLSCSDFFMRISNVDNEDKINSFNGNVSDDDWFCFLKSKFGKEYIKHYSEMFNAESIILENSKYISLVSYDELVMILKRIIVEYPKKQVPFKMGEDVQFIEVESFFNSERRFLIKKRNTNLSFFIRISDFQIVAPRFNNDLFHKFMVGKFGKDYINDYAQHLFSLFEEDALLRFLDTLQKKAQMLYDYLP